MRNSIRKLLTESAWALVTVALVWQQTMIWTMQLNDRRLDEIYDRIDVINCRLKSVVIVTPLNCKPVEDDDDDQVFIERVAEVAK